MTAFIYKITEKETGRCYIGQTKQLERRWKTHHKRFPPDLFEYEVLMQCPADSANFFEVSFIEGYNAHQRGFNKTIGGTGIKVRYPHAESKRKMSEAKKNISAETRRKISEANKRRTHSDETKRKISEAKKNISAETRRKISEAKKGRTLSDETRRKLSEANKGRTPSDETRRKLSESRKGRTHSAETRRKMSESNKKYCAKRKLEKNSL